MNKILVGLFLTVLSTGLFAQNAEPQNQKRLEQFLLQRNDTNLLSSIPFTNIGPTIMSGRVVDIDVNPNNPAEFYVGYASGGVWHTNNNGFSFQPIFDNEATHTIGDIAVNWKENIIWVGTGEVNSSRSSYAGLGIYTSNDSGKTWTHSGLIGTQHIGKILLDPNNKNVAYVASLGSLYTEKDGAPGIFKTMDAGKNWTKLNVSNNDVGFLDIQADSKDAKTLYATAWERSRKAWNFNGNGANSAIYKSKDAGGTWQCITGGTTGFPKNEGIGRIGLAIGQQNNQMLYALVDNQNRQAATFKKSKNLTALQIREMSEVDFLSLPDEKIDAYLRDNDYPKKYNAKSIKEDIKSKKYDVAAVANWVLADAGAALFQTPVIGAELYSSNDGGATWAKTHDKNIEGLYFTYGYYFGNVVVNPSDDKNIFLLGYALIESKDGGKTFKEIGKENVHADHHRLFINPKNTKHFINGNDGGINITFDGGKKWLKANNPAVGQFYAIAVDNAEPYNVYGGLQDNGTWVGPSTHSENDAWHQEGVYAYKEIGGGDGMQVQVDARDNTTIYSGYQFGYYQRSNRNNAEDRLDIHPTYDIGQAALRYNWQTPIWLSQHNNDILYMASNKFHRSMNKGKDMKELAIDLAPTNKSGNVPYGTATSIMESPLQFGLIYVGTDNGRIYKSNDVGNSFESLQIGNSEVDNQLWVSRIIASKYNTDRVFVAFNGYRDDNFKPYLFMSDNQGKTWQKIGLQLPMEPINVVREDPKKSNIIYVGTDNGLYISMDTGKHFIPWQANLPRVAIHDIAIQERDNEIVLGTHGRSIYKASLKHIQNFAADTIKEFFVDSIQSVVFSENWGTAWATYAKPAEPKIAIPYFTKKAGIVNIIIKNNDGKILNQIQDTAKAGYNLMSYDGAVIPKMATSLKIEKADNEKYYLPAGKYQVELVFENKKIKQDFIIKEKK